MKITEMTIDRLQEMMGTEATRAEARIMMATLSRECVTDTDDVSDADWSAWLSQSAKLAKIEEEDEADCESEYE